MKNITKLLDMIERLANELEDEIRAKRCDSSGVVLPGSQRYYDRDMETVNQARRLLKQEIERQRTEARERAALIRMGAL